MAQVHAAASRSSAMPSELNPFLIQIVAGVRAELPAARDAALASLRRMATQLRTQSGFPAIHGMHYALTNRVEQFSEPGKKKDTTATLAA